MMTLMTQELYCRTVVLSGKSCLSQKMRLLFIFFNTNFVISQPFKGLLLYQIKCESEIKKTHGLRIPKVPNNNLTGFR